MSAAPENIAFRQPDSRSMSADSDLGSAKRAGEYQQQPSILLKTAARGETPVSSFQLSALRIAAHIQVIRRILNECIIPSARFGVSRFPIDFEASARRNKERFATSALPSSQSRRACRF
ncbi:MAG: hypothetical protein R3C42_05505 [Parvularculaceae bacterium]